MTRGVAAAALAVGLLACRSHSPSSDANSNWLSFCAQHGECDEGSACICGLCTRTCQADSQCLVGHIATTCVAPSEPVEDLLCAGVLRGSDQRICLAVCREDVDCPGEETCRAGACWPVQAGEARDAGAGVPRDAGSGEPVDVMVPSPGEDVPTGHVVMAEPIEPRGIDAGADLWAFDAAVSFDEAVEVPPPSTTIRIRPDAPSLVGTWHEREADSWYGLRLEIVAVDDGGELMGTITPLCETCEPRGPIAPPVDPDVGYPVELDVQVQSLLRTNLLPHHPYRLYEGRADASGFSFWFSAQDLWRSWCELQTSFPVEVDGRTQYTCVEDPARHDIAPPPDADSRHVLCSADNPVCTCDAEDCRANLRQTVHTVRLTPAGADLVGTWSVGSVGGSPDTLTVRFEREGNAP